MTDLRIKVFGTDIGAELALAFNAMQVPIASACTAAIKTAGEAAKAEGRAHIASAGFSSRWQITWKVKYYPGKDSINAAAWLYHVIPYSLVFEDGATISGKPLLWIPLSGTPNVGKGRPTPGKFAKAGVKLFSISRPGGLPLLAATTLGRAGAGGGARKITLAKLKSGSKKREKARATVATPLFFGIAQAKMPDRFNLAEVAGAQVGKLEGYYNDALKTD